MITTVTIVTTITAMNLTATLSIAAVVILIGLLITKELASTSDSAPRIARFVDVGIIPLIMAFFVIVGVKIAELL